MICDCDRLDDVTSEAKTARDMGVDEKTIKQRGLSDATVYAIDVPANRYDLLCIEGMARSLRTFLGLEKPPALFRGVLLESREPF